MARPTRTKQPPGPPPGEVSRSDRDVLTAAYKSGLILAWKRDDEQGYRLTLGDRRDTYVEAAGLTRYLEGLPKRRS